MNSIQGVSTYALREGFLDAGVMDGDVLICSELMDSRSLFLTANADTVYFCDLPRPLRRAAGAGDAAPDTLGIVDDMWFRWVTDFGLPGADRGRGRQLPAGRPRLRRTAAGGRLHRPPLAHQPRGRSSAARSSTEPRQRPARRPRTGSRTS